MTPKQHTIASAVTTAVFASFSHSWIANTACFLSGILIDVDHVLDYMLYKKSFPWKYRSLTEFCDSKKQGRLYLIFHSYELLLLFIGLGALLGFPLLWLGVFVGVSVHLILDEIYNPLRPLAYFFIFRLKHDFKREYLFTPEYYKKLS